MFALGSHAHPSFSMLPLEDAMELSSEMDRDIVPNEEIDIGGQCP